MNIITEISNILERVLHTATNTIDWFFKYELPESEKLKYIPKNIRKPLLTPVRTVDKLRLAAYPFDEIPLLGKKWKGAI